MRILSLTAGNTDNLGDKAIKNVLVKFYQDVGVDLISGAFYPLDSDLSCKRKTRIPEKENLFTHGLREETIPQAVRERGHFVSRIKKSGWLKNVKKRYDDGKSKRIVKKRLRIYYRQNYSMQKFDIVLIGGGQFIKHNHDFMYCLQYWTRIFKCPVYLIGVGCDGYLSKKEKRIYASSALRCKKVYVRDTLSLEIMRKGLKVKAEFMPDVAFLYNKLFNLKAAADRNLHFISVYDFQTAKNSYHFVKKEEYYRSWLEKIDSFVGHTDQIVFGYSTKQDYLETLEFMKYYKTMFPQDRVSLEKTETLEELTAVLTRVQSVYTARMHILILAATIGKIKLFAFPLSDKLEEFDRMYIRNKFELEQIQEEISQKLKNILKENRFRGITDGE